MTARKSNPALNEAANRLRAAVLERDDGALLGSEEDVQRLLGVSRPTMRQAARLLEREGLLRVKRGNNGGYFGTRPDPAFIERAVSTYLEVLHAEPEDLTMIASVLWIEIVRKAAGLKNAAARELTTRYRERLERVPDEVGFSELLELEQKIRADIFRLIKSPYVELIFSINAEFARRRLSERPSARDGTLEHLAFVAAWRKASVMELEAIADGDVDMAVLAAARLRDLLQRRLFG